jgi:hypothetical protein
VRLDQPRHVIVETEKLEAVKLLRANPLSQLVVK